MSILDLNHGTARARHASVGIVGNLVADLRDHLARRALYRQTVRELAMLSDRELADLGINRAMIRGIAHEAAWGAK